MSEVRPFDLSVEVRTAGRLGKCKPFFTEGRIPQKRGDGGSGSAQGCAEDVAVAALDGVPLGRGASRSEFGEAAHDENRECRGVRRRAAAAACKSLFNASGLVR